MATPLLFAYAPRPSRWPHRLALQRQQPQRTVRGTEALPPGGEAATAASPPGQATCARGLRGREPQLHVVARRQLRTTIGRERNRSNRRKDLQSLTRFHVVILPSLPSAALERYIEPVKGLGLQGWGVRWPIRRPPR